MLPNRKTAISAAVAVFVALYLCLRTQLEEHRSSIRMNRAIECSPIRYNIAHIAMGHYLWVFRFSMIGLFLNDKRSLIFF